MTTLIILTGNILFPLVTILIYNSGASFPGWTFHETLLIQASSPFLPVWPAPFFPPYSG